MKKLFQTLLFGIGLSIGGWGWAQTPVALTPETGRVSLATHVAFLRDPSGMMTFDQAQASTAAGQFTLNQSEKLCFGFTDDAIWFRFVLDLQPAVNSKWFVELAHAEFSEIDWYTVVSGRLTEHVADGNRFHRAPGAVHALYPTKVFDLRGDATTEIYLRLRSPMRFRVPLTVSSPEAYGEHMAHSEPFYLFCLSAFAMLFVMGLIYALVTREAGYLFYAVSAVLMLFYYIAKLGYWRFWGLPGWRFLAANGKLGFYELSLVAIVFYLRWFFDLRTTMPRVARSFLWFALMCLGMTVWLIADGSYLPRLVAGQIVGFVGGSLAIVVAILTLHESKRTASFYLLAWVAFSGLLLLETLQRLDVLPTWTQLNTLPMLGLLLIFSLFQLAMADRVRQMQRVAETAKGQVKQIALEAAARQENEQELREILNNIPTALTVSFMQSGVEKHVINKKFVSLFGYSPEESVSLEFWWLHAYPDEAYRAEIKEWWHSSGIGRGESENASRELRITCQNGEVLDVWARTVYIDDKRLTSFVDISDRLRMEKDLRATKEKLEAMIAALPDLLFRIDREGRIHEFHSAPSNLPYLPPSVFLGKLVVDVMPEETSRIFMAALDEAAVTGYSRGVVYSLPTASGICWYDLSIAVMEQRLGPAENFIILARDITWRKRAEEEALARQTELEEAWGAAERANRAKGLFLANMSHEIRTPLSALVGLSQAMCKQAEKRQLPEDFTRMLEQIRSGGRYLNVMLTNLLDVSAVENGRPRVHVRATALDTWAQSVRDILEPFAVSRHVELRWHDEALVGAERCTDPVRLSQILINLVHNAIKFTPAGKGVDVRFTWRPDFFALEVVDEGAGLAVEQATLFAAFADGVPAISDLDHGVGLGLYVVQTNTDLLGGCVTAGNSPDGGACFRVEWDSKESEV